MTDITEIAKQFLSVNFIDVYTLIMFCSSYLTLYTVLNVRCHGGC
jgi:hypothetical protein